MSQIISSSINFINKNRFLQFIRQNGNHLYYLSGINRNNLICIRIYFV